jgi:hypothetical protein
LNFPDAQAGGVSALIEQFWVGLAKGGLFDVLSIKKFNVFFLFVIPNPCHDGLLTCRLEGG